MGFRARVWRIMAVACILQAAGWAAADCPVNSSTASWHLAPYTDPDPAIGGPVRPEHLTCASWRNGWRAFTFEFWTPELLGSSLHLSGKNLPPNTVFALATAADAAGNPLPSAGTDWVSCGYWSDLGTASSYPPVFENVTGIQLPTQAWRTCGSIATANADALPPAGAIGSAVLVNSAAECCRLCTNTVACRQWGFASSNGSEAGVACTLFSTYSSTTTSSPAVIVGPSAGWGVGYVSCFGGGSALARLASVVISIKGSYTQSCPDGSTYGSPADVTPAIQNTSAIPVPGAPPPQPPVLTLKPVPAIAGSPNGSVTTIRHTVLYTGSSDLNGYYMLRFIINDIDCGDGFCKHMDNDAWVSGNAGVPPSAPVEIKLTCKLGNNTLPIGPLSVTVSLTYQGQAPWCSAERTVTAKTSGVITSADGCSGGSSPPESFQAHSPSPVLRNDSTALYLLFQLWTPDLTGARLYQLTTQVITNPTPNAAMITTEPEDAAGNRLTTTGPSGVSCLFEPSQLGPYPLASDSLPPPTNQLRTCGSIATANADALPPAGAAIGSAVLVNSAAECCRLCTNTVACRQWGFASSNGSEAGVACTLFSTYSSTTTSSPAVIVGPSAGWGVGFVKCTGPGTSQVAAAVLSVSGAINYTCFRNDAYQWGTLTGFRFPTASARITVPAPPGPPVPAGCSGVPPTASSAEPFDAVACNGLASGQACTAPCVTGYEGAARATCTQGVISVTSTCAPKPCVGVPPQTIPNAADWPQQCSPTASGSSCAGSCVDATYKGAPVLVCSLGVFTASGSCTRSQPGPCRASPDSSSITNASPFGSDCDNTPNQGVCTTGCKNGAFGRLISRCIGLGVWGPVSGQCTRAPETPCKSLPAETIPNQQPWPESCADPGTASGDGCDASCLDSYQGGGAKAQCFDGKWLHAGGSCVPKPAGGGNNPAGNDTGSTSQEEATGGYLINASDTADISELLDNLPNQLYNQLGMQPPDTPANVQVDVEVVSGRRRLQQANAVVLKVRVAVVGAKSVDADVLTRRLSSQATTDAVAKGLAAALAAAGRDVTDGSVLGTITAIDSAGAIVGPPLLIKVDCSSSSLKPLSGRDIFVESEPTEVQAGFRMVLPFVAGAITLNPSLDGRAAGCSVQPSDLDGRQDSTDVLVTCSGSIWSGPHTIALQVVYAGATHGCRGATLTELTKVLVQPVKPAPAASLSVAAAPQPPACKAASYTADSVSTEVVGRFDYKLLPAAGVSVPMTITELKATASSPAATCSAQQQGPSLLHSGTVQVTCVVQGVIPPSLDRVGLSLSLTASQQGATATATANTTVDLVCCTPPSTVAHAVATARPAPYLCCGSGAAAAVYHNVGASGVLQGTMATDVSPACSTSAGSQTFGSVTVSCDAARRLLEFNVSNPLGTTAAIEFLVSCSKPAARPKTASNACAAGTGWKRVLLGSKATALGARLELAGTTATVSWVYKMTENSRSCSCSSAYVAVRQVGRFAACSSQELKALHD